jgi:uncharacterized protein YndB with AHSA1/START domain
MTETGHAVALEVEHRFAAPRDQVFDAWTNPEVLKRWWRASDGWGTPLAEVDPREGGSYRLSMKTDQGEVHTVFGEYREVTPPERLAFTWTWEEGPGPVMAGSENTLVVVEFEEDGDGTLVRLTHSGFANEELKGMHEHGWEGVLASLERNVFPG